MTLEELQAALEDVKKELSATKSQLATVLEDKKKAEDLAEKFRKDNDEARKIIQGTASELDVAKKELEAAKSKDGGGSPKEETLEELEAKMTDKDWELADKFLTSVDDPVKRKMLVEDKNHRAQVIKMIKAENPEGEAPVSFRPKKPEAKPKTEEVKDLFELFKRSTGYVPPGPNSQSRQATGLNAGGGGNVWPSEKNRPVDSRVR